MSSLSQPLKNTVLTKNFIFGFVIAVLFYAVLLVGSLLLNQGSLVSMADKLASETVSITRYTMEITQSPPEQATHSDISHEATQKAPNSKPAEDIATQEIVPPPPTEPANKVLSKPVAGLYELNAQGVMLPIIRQSDNLTPFQAYSAPFLKSDGYSQIALVVEEFGLGGEQTQLIEQLPTNTSFIISPYAPKSKNIARTLLENGHEVWIKAPFETVNFPEYDPGPKGILKRASLTNNQDNLKWVMGQAEVYAGIAAYTDTVFSGSNPAMNTLSREIFNRGLGYFELNVGALPQVRDIAEKLNAPYTKNDLVLHDQKWNAQFNEALELLENIAQSRGTAVGVLRAHPVLVKNIQEWSQALDNRKIQIVPLSAIMKLRNPSLTSSFVESPDIQKSDISAQSSSQNHNNTSTSTHDAHSDTHH